MKKRIALVFLALFALLAPSVNAATNFELTWLFSDNRAYDPSYPYPEGSIFYNGNSYWLMQGAADVYGETTHPVYLNSDITPNYEFYYDGEWGPFQNLSIGAFFDFAHPTWGEPFPYPGEAWEDKTYSFSVGCTTKE